MLSEFLETSGKELVKEFGERYNLPYTLEKTLSKMMLLRDAEILAQIEIEKNTKEADTLPPEKDVEIDTKVDNSI